jgi:hypothetical protein
MWRSETKRIDIDRLLIFVLLVGIVGGEWSRRQIGGIVWHAIDVRGDDEPLECAQLLALLIEQLLKQHQSCIGVTNILAKRLKRTGGDMRGQLALRSAPLAADGLVLTNRSSKLALPLMRVFIREWTAMDATARSVRAEDREVRDDATNVRHWHERV